MVATLANDAAVCPDTHKSRPVQPGEVCVLGIANVCPGELTGSKRFVKAASVAAAHS